MLEIEIKDWDDSQLDGEEKKVGKPNWDLLSLVKPQGLDWNWNIADFLDWQIGVKEVYLPLQRQNC